MSEHRYDYRPYRLPSGTWVIAEYKDGKLAAHLEHSFHTRLEALTFLRSNHWPCLDAHSEGYAYDPVQVNGWWTIAEYKGGEFQNHIGEFYTSKAQAEHFLWTHHWPRLQKEGE